MTYEEKILILPAVSDAGLTIWCTNCDNVGNDYYGQMQVWNGYKWTDMIGGPALPPFYAPAP